MYSKIRHPISKQYLDIKSNAARSLMKNYLIQIIKYKNQCGGGWNVANRYDELQLGGGGWGGIKFDED